MYATCKLCINLYVYSLCDCAHTVPW